MRFKADEKRFFNYKVELDGVFLTDAVEADDEEGWVITEKKFSAFGVKTTKREKLYGRVFIVRFDSPLPSTNEL